MNASVTGSTHGNFAASAKSLIITDDPTPANLRHIIVGSQQLLPLRDGAPQHLTLSSTARLTRTGRANLAGEATAFKSLKAELIWRQSWPTRRQAEAAIFQYINGFYNTRRRHSYLGGISPLAFEAKVA